MNPASETERARVLLERGVLSLLLEIIWRSVLFTALVSLYQYFAHPKTFALEDIWITFAFFAGGLTIITFFSLLLAAARYRKHPSKSKDHF